MNLSNHRRRSVPKATESAQVIADKRKTSVVKATLCMNRGIIDAIQRLTYGESALEIRNFRRVAKLANVPEEVVFRVIRDHGNSRRSVA